MPKSVMRIWNTLRGTAENVNGTDNALSQMPLSHRMIHEGRAFTHAKKHLALANGASLTHLVQVGSSDLHVDYLEIIAGGTPVTLEYFENVAVSSTGAPQSFFNNNRSSARSALSAISSAPVITSSGDSLGASFIPNASTNAGQSVGGEAILGGGEWVFKAKTNYAVAVTNNSGGSIDFTFTLFGYEPDNNT